MANISTTNISLLQYSPSGHLLLICTAFANQNFFCIQTLFPGQPNVPVDQAAFLIIELCWLSFINLMLRQQPCHWRPAYRRQNVEHQFHPNIVLVISVLWSSCGSNHWISCRWWWIANCQLAIYHSFLFHPDLQSDSVPAMASSGSLYCATMGLCSATSNQNKICIFFSRSRVGSRFF